MVSKNKTMETHAKRRLYERFGIILTDKVKHDIISMIGTKKAALIEKQSNRVSVYLCTYLDNTFKFVYDKERKLIVTFLYEHETDYWMNGNLS